MPEVGRLGCFASIGPLPTNPTIQNASRKGKIWQCPKVEVFENEAEKFPWLRARIDGMQAKGQVVIFAKSKQAAQAIGIGVRCGEMWMLGKGIHNKEVLWFCYSVLLKTAGWTNYTNLRCAPFQVKNSFIFRGAVFHVFWLSLTSTLQELQKHFADVQRDAGVLHGDLEQDERMRVIDGFRKLRQLLG